MGQIEFLRAQLIALSKVVSNKLSPNSLTASLSTRANRSAGWLRWSLLSRYLLSSLIRPWYSLQLCHAALSAHAQLDEGRITQDAMSASLESREAHGYFRRKLLASYHL